MATSNVVNCSEELRPHVHYYQPSIWTDTFSNFSIDEQVQRRYAKEIEALKQEARCMLMAAATCIEQMILIDTLERLGLAYHFEKEIEQKLQEIYNAEDDCDLFTTSLRFRLIRQHQHNISCNVFEKFVDNDGKFVESLSCDVEGLLSLYEAADVGFRNEKILYEAARFTRRHLRDVEGVLESPLREKVQRALKHPLNRDVPIFYTHFFITIYKKDESRHELLLKLATFNFMFLQNLYKKDLSELSRWWNKFDLKSKLPYARDQMVEAYIWGIGYHYEPEYSYVRTGITKALLIITIMDDTYDNYATVDEAELFTQILDRWSMDGTDRLPNYMKIVFHFISSSFEDYERHAQKLGKKFAASYFKETIQQLGRAYNQELKWVIERRMPPFKDYSKNSEVTSCIYMMFAAIVPGFKSITQETIDWMRENRGGKMITALDCYMKQYGVSKQETLHKFVELAEDLWKDVNKEYGTTTYIPRETTLQFLNYGRLCYATYSNGDGYTDTNIFKAQIVSLFIDPILI